MTNDRRYFDLEERTLRFAVDVRDFLKACPKSMSNFEYSKQLIRSSGSDGANYIEANEALSKKDFVMRIKISKKEAKESRYWLYLMETPEQKQKEQLVNETLELMKIFGSIVESCKNPSPKAIDFEN